MLHSFHKKATLKKRTLSMLLALVLVFTAVGVGFSVAATADAQAVTYYFDTSENLDWNPSGDGERLVATFTNASGAQVGGTVTLSGAGTNLYRVTAPANAENIQLYVVKKGYVMPDSAPAAGTRRVFFNNKPNWNQPYVYAYNGADDSNAKWHGVKMTRITGTTYWYYDMPTRFRYLIFNDGVTVNSIEGNGQTGDIDVTTAKANPVFSKSSGTSWDTAPYYKNYAEKALTTRPAGANEMYAAADGSVQFSKYAYTGADPRAFSGGDTVYLYAPAWTDSSKVYVTWDLDDPYQTLVPMTPDTTYGTGFYKATVPAGARIRFSYNKAASNATVYTSGSASNCYNMKNSANVWCRPETAARGEVTDYTAPVEASGHNTKDAFWTDAVYYDYLSDAELSSGWLNPNKSGTMNNSTGSPYNGSVDEWYAFYNFNDKINTVAKANKSVWSFPLYFGNFCNTKTAHDGGAYHNGPYSVAINGLTNYEYAVNNSNGLKEMHYAVQGLAYGSLDADGNIQYADGYTMPYFDSQWLKDNTVSGRSIGKTVASSFPFRKVPQGNGVTKYVFDSADGRDNVFFNWSGGNPVSVGYGQGASGYGIKDGLDYFMGSGSGYGIFHFNGKNGNGGNNNLDYGFGVKMEMDFRVPENGTLDGTPGGSPVTFSYTGDDDLWVYISEYNADGTLGNSFLALDLGGNHKMSEGSINFKTMTATATKVAQATHNVKYKANTMYIADSYNWNSMAVYAWKDGQGGSWITPGTTTIDGKKYYTVTAEQLNGCQNIIIAQNTGWANQSPNLKVGSYLGNVLYTDNYNYLEERQPDVNIAYTDNKTDTINGGVKLNPNKTYHLSVFYMERGMLESNCKIEFTMTPANNDVKVKKEIETADVNPGLRSAVESREFDFVNTVDGSVNKTAAYRLNNEAYTRAVNSGTGVYQLSHLDTADFDNSYPTGGTVLVTEDKPATGIRYSKTEWEVINNATGEIVKDDVTHEDLTGSYTYSSGSYSTAAATKAFKLSNPDNSYVTRQVNFKNTPQVQDISIAKTLVDENARPVSDVSDEFEFTLLISLDGKDYSTQPDAFVPYRLRYTAHTEGMHIPMYTGDDGSFRFLSGDSVTFSGLPVGASIALIEGPAVGYKPYSVNGDTGYDGTYSTALDGSQTTLRIINQQKPITAEMRIRKFLGSDYETYSPRYIAGELFNFTAEGYDADTLSSLTYTDENGDDYSFRDASAMTKTVSKTDEHGDAYFRNEGASDNFLKFSHTGAYLFKITESENINCTDNYDASAGEIVTYDSDIDTDDAVFLAVFVVKPGEGTELAVDAPVYYRYADPSQPITAALFDDSNKIASEFPEFVNTYEPGEVDVRKTDGAGNPLGGVTFNVYKVGFDGDSESIVPANLAGTDISDDEGLVQIAGLELYEKDDDGNYPGSDLKYRWYALEEVKEADGYAKSTIVTYFTLPMIDTQTGRPTYKITFDYVNGAIKNPQTAGPGTAAVRYAGLGVIALAAVLLLAYVLWFRKKAYVPARVRK